MQQGSDGWEIYKNLVSRLGVTREVQMPRLGEDGRSIELLDLARE